MRKWNVGKRWSLYRSGKYVRTFDNPKDLCKYWRGIPLSIAGEYTYRFLEVI